MWRKLCRAQAFNFPWLLNYIDKLPWIHIKWLRNFKINIWDHSGVGKVKSSCLHNQVSSWEVLQLVDIGVTGGTYRRGSPGPWWFLAGWPTCKVLWREQMPSSMDTVKLKWAGPRDAREDKAVSAEAVWLPQGQGGCCEVLGYHTKMQPHFC